MKFNNPKSKANSFLAYMKYNGSSYKNNNLTTITSRKECITWLNLLLKKKTIIKRERIVIKNFRNILKLMPDKKWLGENDILLIRFKDKLKSRIKYLK